jgi:predicted AAA+ superfamily ATPase
LLFIRFIMKRDIYQTLKEWKDSKNRRPLLIRGARQTGKTYIIQEFGTREFEKLIYINFERNPEYKDIFKTNVPVDIIEKIILYSSQKPESGKTLLFIDEIQECPSAIISLRYFFEEMPQLHIIGAGSLLEFALLSENFRMPVGRIQYLYLYPLSFGEFLDAMGEPELRNYILSFTNLETLAESLHEKLNEYVHKYFIIGGMPAVVNEYITTRDIIKCQRIQRAVIDTYIDDFAKYSKVSRHPHLRKVFNSVPGMVGQKFVYAHVDRSVKSEKLKEALELLETAGIVTRVRQTCGSGLPLSAGVHESFFKVLFLDIGLFHAISGIYSETAKEKDFTAIFKGAVAEQFAGQELIAYQSPYTKAEIYYWGRMEKSSTAEIDYLIVKDAQVVPIEIKSGPTGRMKSLHMFIEKYNCKRALKISQAPFKKGTPVLSLPFYAIESFLLWKEN